MSRPRLVVGFVGSLMMLASSVAHSGLGWPAQREILLQAQVPPDAIRGLSIGWHFGGLAIAVFGLVAGVSFLQTLRGHAPHMRATVIIGFAYTGFGLWFWLLTREPFALVFVLPGLLVLTGALAQRA
jgi:hypothetical protein